MRRNLHEGLGADTGVGDTNIGDESHKRAPVSRGHHCHDEGRRGSTGPSGRFSQSLALSSVQSTISFTCRSVVGASVTWQVVVQTILTASLAAAQVFRETSAISSSSRIVSAVNLGLTILNIVDRERQAMAAALSLVAPIEFWVRFVQVMFHV